MDSPIHSCPRLEPPSWSDGLIVLSVRGDEIFLLPTTIRRHQPPITPSTSISLPARNPPISPPPPLIPQIPLGMAHLIMPPNGNNSRIPSLVCTAILTERARPPPNPIPFLPNFRRGLSPLPLTGAALLMPLQLLCPGERAAAAGTLCTLHVLWLFLSRDKEGWAIADLHGDLGRGLGWMRCCDLHPRNASWERLWSPVCRGLRRGRRRKGNVDKYH